MIRGFHKQFYFLAGFLTSAAVMAGCGKTGGTASTSSATSSSCSVEVSARAAAAAPKVRSKSAMADHGLLSDDQELSVMLALNLNNPNDLEQLNHDLYDPASPRYRQFLTPQEFHDRYAPSDTQVADVISFLESHGMHDFVLNPNGYLLQAKGSPSALSSAFVSEIHEYQDADGAKFYSSTDAPVLPATLPIQAVIGMENISRLHNHVRMPAGFVAGAPTQPMLQSRLQSRDQPNGGTPDGTGPYYGLSPSNIKTAYGIPGTVTGSGQTLALLELDGYTASDVSAYESYFGLTKVPLDNVLIDGATGSDDCSGGGVEVTLDIELMAALAPGATKIMVYMAPNTIAGLLAAYAQIANDDVAKQISTSWGISETEFGGNYSTMISENTIFTQMSTQGQSFYAAAGDSGAYDNQSSLSVDDPASQPYAVGVGGTKLTLGAASAYSSETSWNDGGSAGSYEGGGGGISTYWSLPNYQSGAAGAGSGASAVYRNVPDVALEAEPNQGYSIYYGGSWTLVGGTSCAAPLWAAFNALVNQKRIANGSGYLGFPNTAIYSIGTGANYTSNFHDIADGSTNLHYSAVSGYDLSTGWGSFKGTTLFNSLVAY